MSFYKPCPPDDLGDINLMSLGHSSSHVVVVMLEQVVDGFPASPPTLMLQPVVWPPVVLLILQSLVWPPVVLLILQPVMLDPAMSSPLVHAQKESKIKVWDELTPPLPKRWIPVESYLQSLGTGKFCIVKTFDTVEEGWCREKNGNMFKNVERFAVFTGVKVERGSRGAFRMIKHKSRRYSFGQRIVQTFLF
ncbi:uncharacterized protein LOC111258151 [Setaria italica]|uniref:uncharacterized protein LOC111258151 n=1 Tax=Setaria italica TaxID=4555 RepID=UPI0006477D2B|nr:uncharacterized protein LOC111258151 [Setaria italica]